MHFGRHADFVLHVLDSVYIVIGDVGRYGCIIESVSGVPCEICGIEARCHLSVNVCKYTHSINLGDCCWDHIKALLGVLDKDWGELVAIAYQAEKAFND